MGIISYFQRHLVNYLVAFVGHLMGNADHWRVPALRASIGTQLQEVLRNYCHLSYHRRLSPVLR